MKKLFSTLGLLFMLAFMLTGCELYFGKKNDSGGGGDRQPGWSCTADADCAAGCYCDGASAGKEGECAEAGFCDNDADCPPGYVCDDRSSCVPDTTPPPKTCNVDQDCPVGSICNNGLCEVTCTCQNDAEVPDGMFCDENRGTCHPDYPSGTCGGEPSCGTPPICPLGSVGVLDTAGCYTGQCNAIATCDVAPACKNFQHRDDCINPNDESNCQEVVNGIDCKKTTDGTPCQPGDMNCQCASIVYASCRNNAQ